MSRHGRIHWVTCDGCGKRGYLTRKEARRARDRDGLQGLSAYECLQHPGHWHLGHLPAGVIHGQYSRDDLTGRTA